MPDFSYNPVTQSEFQRQTFLTLIISFAVPAIPFAFLRCILLFLPNGLDHIVPDALIGDFAIIGVGVFFGNIVSYGTAIPLSGWTGIRPRTASLLLASVIGSLCCWGGYQALSLSVGGVITAKLDHDYAREILYGAVPFASIFSACFYISHVRDQILQHEERAVFEATGGLVRGSTISEDEKIV